MKDIVLIGGGGYCKAVIDIIEQEGTFRIIGIIEKTRKKASGVFRYKIIGEDSDLESLRSQCKYAVISIGAPVNLALRKKMYTKLKSLDFSLPNIISPRAYVSSYATLTEANFIMHDANINAGAIIGSNNILQTKSVIEHDATVGDHNYFSTGCIINGDVQIGNSCLFGSGSIVNNSKQIIDEVVIGSGGVVTKDILIKGTYLGIPAKKVE